ncbi:MAG: hypothetical protein ACRYFK_12160 [Janthinobacterium lividum]
MPRLYLLALLLLAGLPARAQDSLAPARPPVADTARPRPAAPAAPDTAAALHRLFAAKRGLRAAVVVGTVVTGGVILALDGLFASDSRNGLVSFVEQGQIIGVTSLIVLVEVLAESKYNRKKEQRALADWRAHRLAPDLQQRLTPHYFVPPGLRRP